MINKFLQQKEIDIQEKKKELGYSLSDLNFKTSNFILEVFIECVMREKGLVGLDPSEFED